MLFPCTIVSVWAYQSTETIPKWVKHQSWKNDEQTGHRSTKPHRLIYVEYTSAAMWSDLSEKSYFYCACLTVKFATGQIPKENPFTKRLICCSKKYNVLCFGKKKTVTKI